MREATKYTNRSDAAEFLKKRMADALGGKIILSKNVTYDLRDLIITDYINNGRKSLGDLKSTRLPRLDVVFGGIIENPSRETRRAVPAIRQTAAGAASRPL